MYKYFVADTVLLTQAKKKKEKKKERETKRTVRAGAPSITHAGSTIGNVANVHE